MNELKRRNVFRVAVVYLATAWLLLQVVSTVAPILELSAALQKAILVLLAIGFVPCVVVAWAFERTPQGLRLERPARSDAQAKQRVFDRSVIFVLSLAVVYFLVDELWLEKVVEAPEVGRSVAVLPFDNLSNEDANEPFTTGIHDDLLTHLSRIASLKTTSRTSVLKYANTDMSIPEIAAELGVAAIVEGGVQRAGDRVRINVQLIDATRDAHLWAETYDRELTAQNVFQIQSEIAQEIAAKLKATLTEEERKHIESVPTQNIAALETYFIGKRLLEDRTRESLRAAIEYFEKVVQIDPEFALGWSGLADAYMLLPEYSPFVDTKEMARKSREAVERALSLDPDIPEVKSSEAWHQLIHFYDWAGAEKTFREALEIVPDNPNVLHWLSHTVSWQGRHAEAIEYAKRAVEADPESKMMRTNLAYILVDAGRFDEGLGIARESELFSPEYLVQRRNLYLHELRAGNAEAAAETFVSYASAIGADEEAAGEIGAKFIAYSNKGTPGRLTPDLIERAQLSAEDLAQVMAFIGDSEGTLKALREAIDLRSGSRSVLSMKINPAYDFIRGDPRFQEMLREVGLADS